MTIQKKDRIYLDGKLYQLMSSPLKAFFELHSEIPAFSGRLPECRRGYVATWRIRNNVLYLTGFQQFNPTVVINPKDVLASPKMLADWYDGTLRIPVGDIIHHSKNGCDVHDRVLHISVKGGVVYNHEVFQNNCVSSGDSDNCPF